MALSVRAKRALAIGLVLGGPVAVACSAREQGTFVPQGNLNPDNPTPSDDSDGSSGPATGVITGSSGSSGTGQVFMAHDAGPATTMLATADAACAAQSMTGTQQRLNAYIMQDYSESMRMNGKWTGISSAINSFVMQPTMGISLGLQYFSQTLPDAGPAATKYMVTTAGDSCNPAQYAVPEIPIQPMPAVGTLISQSFAMHTQPWTGTPTAAALTGAIQYATSWANAHPADATVVILATDGLPDEEANDAGAGGCRPVAQGAAAALTEVNSIAAAGVAQTPKILTFVIGVGTETANLNAVAQAGGTGSAFIVDTSQNVAQQFLAALNRIRSAALGCTYTIPLPDAGKIDFKAINVQFTPSGGQPETVYQVADMAHCPTATTGMFENGWYYDNPTNPTKIQLCSTACGAVATGGTINVLTGCSTMELPTK